MTRPTRILVRGVAIAAIAVSYAYLTHLSNVNPNAGGLGVLLALTPVVCFGGALVAQSLAELEHQRRYAVAVLLLCLVGAWWMYRHWTLLEQHSAWLNLAQQAGAYGLLGLAFARSMRAGRVALCTQWATKVHSTMTPELTRYTRSVTLAWALFCGGLSTTLLVLFVLAPLPVWSAFANFCTFPLMLAMFGVEYLVRRRVLPSTMRTKFLVSIQAYFTAPPSSRAVATPAAARHYVRN